MSVSGCWGTHSMSVLVQPHLMLASLWEDRGAGFELPSAAGDSSWIGASSAWTPASAVVISGDMEAGCSVGTSCGSVGAGFSAAGACSTSWAGEAFSVLGYSAYDARPAASSAACDPCSGSAAPCVMLCCASCPPACASAGAGSSAALGGQGWTVTSAGESTRMK